MQEPQRKHEDLIKFINEKFEANVEHFFKPKVNKGRKSNSFTQKDVNSINQAVRLLVSYFNLYGGSAGEFDFYRLLQNYMTDKSKRKEIHKILNVHR